MWFYCSREKKKKKKKLKTQTPDSVQSKRVLSVCLDPLNPRLRFTSCVFVPLFFFHAFWSNAVTVHWTVIANVDFSAVNSTSVYCLWTHKFHFSVTFSLKMGPTTLFTHLKIILLQCFQFSVFSFSKISSIQIDPKCTYAKLLHGEFH